MIWVSFVNSSDGNETLKMSLLSRGETIFQFVAQLYYTCPVVERMISWWKRNRSRLGSWMTPVGLAVLGRRGMGPRRCLILMVEAASWKIEVQILGKSQAGSEKNVLPKRH